MRMHAYIFNHHHNPQHNKTIHIHPTTPPKPHKPQTSSQSAKEDIGGLVAEVEVLDALFGDQVGEKGLGLDKGHEAVVGADGPCASFEVLLGDWAEAGRVDEVVGCFGPAAQPEAGTIVVG